MGRLGRRTRRAFVLAGAVVGLAVIGLLLWAPWRSSAPSPAPAPARGGPARGSTSSAPVRAEPGRLRIDFDHPLRTGTLRVFVDDELALEERLRGQQRKKALLFKVHEGSFRDELEVRPGLHEVRMEVRWDEDVRTERIIGSFRSGATRRLEASLGRVRRDLKLEWK